MKDQYIYGTRAIIEAIEAGKEIEKVFVKKDLDNDLVAQLKQLLRDRKIPSQFVPIERINRISRKNHQGCLAIASPVEYQSIENIVPMLFEKGATPLILILDGITDVRNFGAICRTAHCTGVDAVVVALKGAAPINADAIKTSAGAIHHIAICREGSLRNTIMFLKNSGIQIVACTEKTDNLIYDVDMTIPTAIIMGAEDVGISTEFQKISSEYAKIPMTGNIASLNVSVAAGVILYEAVRQRIG